MAGRETEWLIGQIEAGEIVILDGGMGSELEAVGVTMNPKCWSGQALYEEPDRVREVHRSFIDAGADVIISNTFSCGYEAVKQGLGKDFLEANRIAIELAKEARDGVDRPVAIAGSISVVSAKTPQNVATNDWSMKSYEDAIGDLRLQARSLADAGADLIVLEMISGAGYGRAAIEASLETGLPVWLGISPGFTPDEEVKANADPLERVKVIETGERVDDLLRALLRPELALVALMHTTINVVHPALEMLREQWDGPVGVYPESGVWQRPHWELSDLSAEEFLAEAKTWVDAGVQVVGGCCGVRPDHIAALRQGLPQRVAT